MIDFLYFGEANVYQENLDSFLAVAEELQLKGLMGSGTEKGAEEGHHKQEIPTVSPSSFVDKPCSVAKVETLPPLEGTVAVTDYTVAANLQDLDDKIKSMMMFSENHAGKKSGRARICKVCGKEGKKDHIVNHIEANHITGVSHTCIICGTVARSRAALAVHRSIKHRSQPHHR